MSLRNRVLDLLPILVVVAVVTAFGAYCLLVLIAGEPTTGAPRTQSVAHASSALPAADRDLRRGSAPRA